MPPGATVVQNMSVVVDAQTEAFEQKLLGLETRLNQLEKTGGTAPKAAIDGADALGDRYAKASQRIAFATEEMSRMGEIGGRGLRELLSQAGEMATAFGGSGAIVGGIAVLGLAFSEMFAKARKEMDDMERAWDQTISNMVKAKDIIGLSSQMVDLKSGEGPFATQQKNESDVAFAARQAGIDATQHEVDFLNQKLHDATMALATTLAGAPGTAAGDAAAKSKQAEVEQITKDVDAWSAALAKLKRNYDFVSAAQASVINSKQGDFQAVIDRLREKEATALDKSANALTLQGAKTDDVTAKTLALARAQGEDLTNAIETALAAFTSDSAAAAVAAIEARSTKLREQIALNEALSASEKERLGNDLAKLEAIQELEAQTTPLLKQGILELGAFALPGGSTAPGAGDRLMAQQQALLAVRQQLKEIGGDTQKIDEQLLAIDKARADALKELVKPSKDIALTQQQALRDAQDHARALHDAADGALQLAAAFGLVDASSENVLRSVAEIATQLPLALKTLAVYRSGATDDKGNPVAGIGAVAAAALPVAGAVATVISSFVGAAEAQHKAALELQAAAEAFAKSAKQYESGGTSGSVADQLAQNAQQYTDLVAQGIELLKAAARSGNVKAGDSAAAGLSGLPAAEQQHVQQITHDFWAGIAQSLNNLRGPAGALDNQLQALTDQLQQNLDAVDALGQANGETADQIKADQQKVLDLYNAQVAAAKKAAAEQATTQAATDRLSLEAAGARTLAQKQQLARDQLEEQEREEMQQRIDAGADTATVQLLQTKDALEQLGLAAEQAAEKITDAENTIAQNDDVFGTDATTSVGEYAKAYNIDLSAYDLSTKAGADAAISYLQGLYTSLDPNDPNYALNRHELQQLVDKIRALPVETSGATTGAASSSGSGATADAGQSPGEVAVSEVRNITTTQGDVFIDTLRAILSVDREWLSIVKDFLRAAAATIITPPQIPLGLGAFAGAAGAGGTVTIAVNVQQTFNGPVGQVDRAAALAFGNLIIEEINAALASDYLNAQRIQGKVIQT